jgi:pilus assembly protein CpaB
MVAAAIVLGLLAFFATAGYAASIDSQVGDKVTVYKMSKDVPALQELGDDDVTAVKVPRKWVGAGVFTDKSFLGRKTFVAVQKGAYLDSAALIPVQEITKGEREIAINIDAESGVGGRIRPGDYVNVLATTEEQDGNKTIRSSDILISRARVVSIGGQETKSDGDGNQDKVVPVTFALSDTESLVLLYAETFAKVVRLSKVPVDDVDTTRTDPVTNFDFIKRSGG